LPDIGFFAVVKVVYNYFNRNIREWREASGAPYKMLSQHMPEGTENLPKILQLG
jgi:hypothetical protein